MNSEQIDLTDEIKYQGSRIERNMDLLKYITDKDGIALNRFKNTELDSIGYDLRAIANRIEILAEDIEGWGYQL